MRLNAKIMLLLALVAGSGFFAMSVMYGCADSTASGNEEGYTFRLTSLTESPLYLQHGIETYITLNMIENGDSEALSIDDPPPFPLTATLEYQTFDGQTRKLSSSYGYRC